jgi:hypothetical protein
MDEPADVTAMLAVTRVFVNALPAHCKPHMLERELMTVDDLVYFWRQCPIGNPPFCHPEDETILRQYGRGALDCKALNFEQYMDGARFHPKDTGLHLSLLPVPYVGDLQSADVFILLLNPGFNSVDYYAESLRPEFVARHRASLRQEFLDRHFRFTFLDPTLCWHSGYSWWERRLRKVALRVAIARFGNNYLSALQHLAQRTAALELVPYHSTEFNSDPLIERLPSVRAMRDFLRSSLLPRAQTREITIVVTRRAADWGNPQPSEKVVVLPTNQARNPPLSPGFPAGDAILRQFGLDA